MKIFNSAITPICPKCIKVMWCDKLVENGENIDITIVCKTHYCENKDIEYILPLQQIEVQLKGGDNG